MRQFLTAFLCLSTFALAQNVIAVVPTAADGLSPALHDGEAFVAALGIPDLATMMMLVVGLSGLTAAGTRADDGKRIERPSD